METATQSESRPGGGLTLPPIAAMTQGISTADTSPGQQSQQSSSHFDIRDSGNWSMQSQQSKHSSTVSSNTGFHLHSILNSDDSPSRFSTGSGTPGSTPHSAARSIPTSRPTDGVLPAINQSYENNKRQSSTEASGSFLDSRRSSIDSRMGATMGHLNIGTSSPYDSINASQASIASNLQQQRGIHTPLQSKANGVPGSSPTERPGTSGTIPPPSRRAPAIANPRDGGMPNPMASTPTKGYAWAFPGDFSKDEIEITSSPASSRHNSLAASSVHTMDSAPVQMRTGRFPDEPLPHRSVTSLQSDPSQFSTGNYSRTPELRVSHKLAERKRRSEMKDLFDELNRHIPNNQGSKSSKWEVLSKAIEYITGLKEAYRESQREIDKLRADMEHARIALEENRAYQTEITAMYQQLLRVDPQGHHIFGPKTHLLEQELASQQSNGRLAPIQVGQQQPPPAHQGSWQPASQMQGVEYGHPYDRR